MCFACGSECNAPYLTCGHLGQWRLIIYRVQISMSRFIFFSVFIVSGARFLSQSKLLVHRSKLGGRKRENKIFLSEASFF